MPPPRTFTPPPGPPPIEMPKSGGEEFEFLGSTKATTSAEHQQMKPCELFADIAKGDHTLKKAADRELPPRKASLASHLHTGLQEKFKNVREEEDDDPHRETKSNYEFDDFDVPKPPKRTSKIKRHE